MSDSINKHFYCPDCRYYFLSSDFSENKDTGQGMTICPLCKKTICEVPWYYANLPKMWANPHQVGPQSPEAKKRSSLNGFKHGLYTKTHTIMAPALHGKYPECATCDYSEPCKNGDYRYCPINLTMILKYIQAFEDGKLDDLKSFAGMTQGWMFNILKIMYHEILNKTTLVPKVISEKNIPDKDGGAKQTTLEWQANPLLKRIPEFMVALGLTAEQQMMTPSKKQDQDNVAGFLKAENTKSDDIKKFIDEIATKMKNLQEDIKKSINLRKDDQALKDFENEQGENEP